MPVKSKAENWPQADHKAVTEKIKAITEGAKELTEFESKFLQEILRQALVFRERLRMTPKQVEILEGLDTKYLLGDRIKAKVKKTDTHKETPA